MNKVRSGRSPWRRRLAITAVVLVVLAVVGCVAIAWLLAGRVAASFAVPQPPRPDDLEILAVEGDLIRYRYTRPDVGPADVGRMALKLVGGGWVYTADEVSAQDGVSTRRIEKICDDGEANNIDGLCRSDCSLGVSAELHALDCAYLCSDHLDLNTRSINIYGLENGVDYNFVLVTYDAAGNPQAHPIVAQATPDRVFERLPGDPHTGCDCRGTDVSPWSALVLLLGLGRRRRVVRR